MADLEITNRAPTWGELILVQHCHNPASNPLPVLMLIVARTNLNETDVAMMGIQEVLSIFDKVLAEMKVGLQVARMSMQMRE